MATYLRAASAIATILIFTACAGNPAGVKPNTAGSGPVAQNSACLTQTGSRIATNDIACEFGRSYSSEDISRTGSTTADGALRLLDPSITVHR
jgi:hypothetical protein